MFELFNSRKIQMRVVFWLSFALIFFLVLLPIFFFFYLFSENKVRNLILNQFNQNQYQVQITNVVPIFWHGLSLQITGMNINKSKTNLIHINKIACQLSWFDLAFGDYAIKRLSIHGMSLQQEGLKQYGLSDLFNHSSKNNGVLSKLEILSLDQINLWSAINKTIFNSANFLISDLNKTQPNISGVIQLDSNHQFKIQSHDIKLTGMGFSIESATINGIWGKVTANLITKIHYAFNDPVSVLKLSNLHGKMEFFNKFFKVNIQSLAIDKERHHAAGIAIQELNDKSFSQFSFNSDNVIYDHEFNNLIATKSKIILNDQINSTNFNLVTLISKLNYKNGILSSNDCNSEINFLWYQLNQKFNIKVNGNCNYDFKRKITELNLRGTINNSIATIKLMFYNQESISKIMLNTKLNSLELNNNTAESAASLYYNKITLFAINFPNLKFVGQLQIANLFFNHHLLFNDLSTQFNITKNKIDIAQISARIFAGRLNGSLQFNQDLNDSLINVDVMGNLNHLQLQQIFNSLFAVTAIDGEANLDFNLHAKKIATFDQLHKKITGSIKLEANKGKFNGVDFGLFLTSNSLSDIKNDSYTVFNHLLANFNFIGGVSKGKLLFYSPQVYANGSGGLDLIAESINYQLQIKSNLPKNNQNLKSVTIPVDIVGNLFNPKFIIQNMQLNPITPKILNIFPKPQKRLILGNKKNAKYLKNRNK